MFLIKKLHLQEQSKFTEWIQVNVGTYKLLLPQGLYQISMCGGGGAGGYNAGRAGGAGGNGFRGVYQLLVKRPMLTPFTITVGTGGVGQGNGGAGGSGNGNGGAGGDGGRPTITWFPPSERANLYFTHVTGDLVYGPDNIGVYARGGGGGGGGGGFANTGRYSQGAGGGGGGGLYEYDVQKDAYINYPGGRGGNSGSGRYGPYPGNPGTNTGYYDTVQRGGGGGAGNNGTWDAAKGGAGGLG